MNRRENETKKSINDLVSKLTKRSDRVELRIDKVESRLNMKINDVEAQLGSKINNLGITILDYCDKNFASKKEFDDLKHQFKDFDERLGILTQIVINMNKTLENNLAFHTPDNNTLKSRINRVELKLNLGSE